MGAIRIVHEKYRAKKVSEEYENFKNSFNNAIEATPEMKAHISKAQEDMNPLRVLNLFKAITDEVNRIRSFLEINSTALTFDNRLTCFY